MNLKRQYQRLFEGRQKFAKANSLVTNDRLLEDDTFLNDPAANLQDRGMPENLPLDIKYFEETLNTLQTSIEEVHRELSGEVQSKSETTGNYEYDTMEKQISRYINGASKQLEGLIKYLDRQQRRGL